MNRRRILKRWRAPSPNACRIAPDGYTLALATMSQAVFNTYLFPKLPYDPIRDLEPIAPLVTGAMTLAAHPSFPASTLPEFIALAKARPGPRSCAISFSRRHHSPNRSLQQQFGTGPAHLVGTSYGALVALLYAMRHPDAVLSLALAEPPLHRWACRSTEGQALYSAFMTEVWRASAGAFARGEDALALQLLVDGIAGHPVFETLPPNRVAAAWRNARAMRALTHSTDPFPDLSRAAVAALAMPVLLIRAEQCSGLYLCVMKELARVLPGAMQAVISDAGHGSPLENPAAFNARILSLMDVIPAAQAAENRHASSAGRYLPL